MWNCANMLYYNLYILFLLEINEIWRVENFKKICVRFEKAWLIFGTEAFNVILKNSDNFYPLYWIVLQKCINLVLIKMTWLEIVYMVSNPWCFYLSAALISGQL